MFRALELARKGSGKTSPNPLAGCVIVKNGKIIAEGFHRRFGAAHAEIEALNKASSRANRACLYVNLEPCAHFGKTPPCVDAIIKAGIKEVIIGMHDPNPLNDGKGIKILRAAGIKVEDGVCEKEARELNSPFIKYINKGMPYVTLKMAQSLDGKIATRTGDSKWISSENSRRLVHQLRKEADAVMVGAGTVLRDDPLLTARLAVSSLRFAASRPIKIIVDSKLRIPLNSKIFSKKSPAKTIIATTNLSPKKRIRQFQKKNAEILIVNNTNGRVNLKALMKMLAKKGIINILAEGGANLAASLLDEGFVDKVLFFIAPKIIGNKNRVNEALVVKNLTAKKTGKDFLLEGRL